MPPKLLFLSLILFSVYAIDTHIVDNTCTFKSQGKLFSLVALNRAGSNQQQYSIKDGSDTIFFNFCQPFIPQICKILNQSSLPAYSYLLQKQSNEQGQPQTLTCTPYSSDSKTAFYRPQYSKTNNQIQLNLSMWIILPNSTSKRQTQFIIDCIQTPQNKESPLVNIKLRQNSQQKIVIYGQSQYGCPVFHLNSIWKALNDNTLVFGALLFIIGFVFMFYGILMTSLIIFLTSYFISFAVLTGIATAFLGINSSTIAIYFALLIIVFLSTLLAYGITKLLDVSVFFVGAFLGFIMAAMAYSLINVVTGIYSVWLLVVLQIGLTVSMGLLTFKYSQQIIILSSSLTGAYMVVRPISWIVGGFPNQFTLYQMIDDGQLVSLPWSVFLYIIIILLLAALGSYYQMLKIHRKDDNATIQQNFITQNLQGTIDMIHQAVKGAIQKVTPSAKNADDYESMREMGDVPQQKRKSSGIKGEFKQNF